MHRPSRLAFSLRLRATHRVMRPINSLMSHHGLCSFVRSGNVGPLGTFFGRTRRNWVVSLE
ncbi:MAG: hypothetical protein ABS79_07285 [Planctomycetes bacterium SCN 63-9]|nr:MAG: hypothetical protein ABS79_07285 [Planctomycetes bacterium SCN 63-9]